jgi:hypothetical protein
MDKTMKRLLNGWTGALLTLVMVGCGGGSSSVDVQSVGPQGATFAVAGSALQVEIPAGAVQRETELRFREVEPRQGEVRAFQVEPELDSAAAIRVTVKLDDSMGQGAHHLVEVENEVEHGAEAEVEDAAEHQLEGEIHHLGHLGVKRADDGAAHDTADDKNAPAPTPADDKGTI